MSVYFTAPEGQRAGVVAGFVLSAPVYGGIARGAGAAVTFPIYNDTITVQNPQRTISIGAGFVHYIQIGEATYQYVQQHGVHGSGYGEMDWVSTICTALVDLINAAPDANATATTDGEGVTLTPRQNTGATIYCVWDGVYDGNLVELEGNELIPTLTRGVLFAQGTMYRPATAPEMTAAPAGQKSWLFYSSTGGFYWQSTSTPTASDDAYIGWVAASAAEIVALSSSRIGTGAEAVVLPGGAGVLAISGVVAAADTGAPTGAPGIGVATFDSSPAFEATPGRLWLNFIGFEAGTINTAGVYMLVYMLWYLDELAEFGTGLCGALAAAMAPGDTSGNLGGGTLPVTSPKAVVFTFVASGTVGGVPVGPGYPHNIAIAAATYVYFQVTGDTAATIAANLAALIQEAVDPNAMATAAGATVVLTPLESNAQTVSCSASDGNTPQTLTETQPSYYLIDDIEPPAPGQAALGEIIEVLAANGSQIVRGQLGTAAAAHPAGALVWRLALDTQYLQVNMAQFMLTAGILLEIPFRGRALAALQAWAVNEFGDSPVTTNNYIGAGGYVGSRGMRGLSGGQLDLQIPGTLAVESDAAPIVTMPQTMSLASVTATVKQAPTGGPITLSVYGDPVTMRATVELTIAAGTTSAVMDMTTSPNVDGLWCPAGTQIKVDITGVGSTFAGSDLTVTLRF